MSEKKIADKAAPTEFDTNNVLKPFKGCPELDSVQLGEKVTATSGDLRRMSGLVRSDRSRIFIRTIAGIPFVTHVDPTDQRGMPCNIPLAGVAGCVTLEDRRAREAVIEKAAQDAKDATEKAQAEQREAMLAQEARKRGEHEKVAEAE